MGVLISLPPSRYPDTYHGQVHSPRLKLKAIKREQGQEISEGTEICPMYWFGELPEN